MRVGYNGRVTSDVESGALATAIGSLHWLVRYDDRELSAISGSEHTGLLNEAETSLWNAIKSYKRRRDWLLGRRAGKQLIAKMLQERDGRPPSLDRIAILPHPDGWPIVSLPDFGDNPLAVTLSISHTHNWAFCAAVKGEGRPLGADVEFVETRSLGFVEDYFTPLEISYLTAAPNEQRTILTNAIWSGKEAALKAIRRGLAEDTRIVSCMPHPLIDDTQVWLPMRIVWNDGRIDRPLPRLTGWWRQHRDLVLTLAVEAESE